MQFLSAGRYIANVADEKVTLYKKSAATPSPATDYCRVANLGASFMGKTQVSVEFIAPTPGFWNKH
jgi:hypothetical protein